MASKTVTEASPYYLPVSDIDRADALCCRIDAIADCLGSAEPDSFADGALMHTCEAMREMVCEVRTIISQRVTPQATHA